MKLINTLKGSLDHVKPVWMMRQAGRYLPEYKKLRSNFPSFIDFCFNPEAVLEATLQPIKRFDLDAAIIFSDILVIPNSLGQKVNFIENVGPVLHPIESLEAVLNNELSSDLSLAYRAISQTRQALAKEKALIGFAGCPWTISAYMLGYKKANGFAEVIAKAENTPNFVILLNKLAVHVASHCTNQIHAGANVIQLFESWAGAVPPSKRQDWVFAQAQLIIQEIRKSFPDVPVIYFAKGCVQEAINNLGNLNITFSVDENTNLSTLSGADNCLQGNLSPIKLADGNFEEDVLSILDFAKNRPFVVNLGHGILPHTPIANVEKFITLVRSGV